MYDFIIQDANELPATFWNTLHMHHTDDSLKTVICVVQVNLAK